MHRITNLGLSSNEAKEQRIMALRTAFQQHKVATVASAVKLTGYSRVTVLKWCKEGNIPLWDERKQASVVPMTVANTPAWLK